MRSYLFCFVISVHLFGYGPRNCACCSYFGLHVLPCCAVIEPNLKAIPEFPLLQGAGAG